MMTKMRLVAFLAVFIFFSAGTVRAEERGGEFIINTVVSAKAFNLLYSGESTRSESSSRSANLRLGPSPSPEIASSAREELSGFLHGEKTENILFTTSLVTLTALNVADYLTTRQALKNPALGEGNPLMKPFAKNAVLFAVVKAGTTALSFYGLQKLFKRNKTAAWVLTMTSNFILSYVVANNMRLIQKARTR